jgi:hypothetical protein
LLWSKNHGVITIIIIIIIIIIIRFHLSLFDHLVDIRRDTLYNEQTHILLNIWCENSKIDVQLFISPADKKQSKQISWPESASELYRPNDRRLLAKLVPTFADGGCQVFSVADPYGRILGFLDRSRNFFFQVAPQL